MKDSICPFLGLSSSLRQFENISVIQGYENSPHCLSVYALTTQNDEEEELCGYIY